MFITNNDECDITKISIILKLVQVPIMIGHFRNIYIIY